MSKPRVELKTDINTKKGNVNSSSTAGVNVGPLSTESTANASIGSGGLSTSNTSEWNIGGNAGIGEAHSQSQSFTTNGVALSDSSSENLFGLHYGSESSLNINDHGITYSVNTEFNGHEQNANINIPAPRIPTANTSSSLPSIHALLEQAQHACAGIQDYCSEILQNIPEIKAPSLEMSFDLAWLSTSTEHLSRMAGDTWSTLQALSPIHEDTLSIISEACSSLFKMASGFIEQGGALLSSINLGAIAQNISDCVTGLAQVVSDCINQMPDFDLPDMNFD